MTLEGDSKYNQISRDIKADLFLDYSSILLHVGTANGLLVTLKILPQAGGRYGVQPAGVVAVDDRVVRIAPIQAEIGHTAYATQQSVANLRQGAKVNGVLLVVTPGRPDRPSESQAPKQRFQKIVMLLRKPRIRSYPRWP